jgi:hypothetical protein
MHYENILNNLLSIQKEMNNVAERHPGNYEMYLVSKAIAELAYMLRSYMIQKGGPEQSSQE